MHPSDDLRTKQVESNISARDDGMMAYDDDHATGGGVGGGSA
jgi:hypothetical protein